MMTDQIIKQIGYPKLAQALGVNRQAVVNAKRNQIFPASWFNVIEQLCVDRGIDCPRELFNWRSSAEIAPLEKVGSLKNNSQNSHGIAS